MATHHKVHVISTRRVSCLLNKYKAVSRYSDSAVFTQWHTGDFSHQELFRNRGKLLNNHCKKAVNLVSVGLVKITCERGTMRSLLKALCAVIYVSTFFEFVSSVNADPLPEPWQSQREAAKALSAKACAGDKAAIKEIEIQIFDSNLAVMSNTGWLRSNCDAFKKWTAFNVANYQEQAAYGGYPIAMLTYGIRLIAGRPRSEKQLKLGIKMMERAAAAGYGVAAVRLAELYTSGKNVERDLEKARKYLAIAKAEGVEESKLSWVTEQLGQASAGTNQSQGSSNETASTSPSVNWDKVFKNPDEQTNQSAGASGNVQVGESLYRAKCFSCHSLNPNRNGIGPHFYQLFGRAAGSAERFRYSSGLEEAGEKGLVWSTENVGEYLATPKEFMQKWTWDRQRHSVTCRRVGNIKRNETRKDLYRVLDCKVAFNQQDMRDLSAYLNTQ